MGGIEEEDKVGCVDMIFENYKHHDLSGGVKGGVEKSEKIDINQIAWEVVVL